MSLMLLFTRFIILPKGKICLAREEIVGYEGSINCCVAFADDELVFAVFIAVRRLL